MNQLKNKQNLIFLLFSIFCTIIFMFPYLVKDVLPLEHDTLFHLSRIEGLATSISEGTLIPRIYPYKNLNFGYASPLFYSDFFLFIPAILYNIGFSIASCYKLVVILSTLLSSFFIMTTTFKITKNKYTPYLASVLYLFNNYRITDVYVRGALGEIMGFIFLPIVLLGIYYVLYDDCKKWGYLVVSFGGLILTHNITFYLACICFGLFILIRLPFLLKEKIRIKYIAQATLLTILCTAFFTLPMLEQLSSQDFYLNYYTSSSSLSSSTLPLWKYFVNDTVFGYGSIDTPKDSAMLLNIGYFLMFVPVLFLFKVKKMEPFILHSLIIGYILLILPLSIFPWNTFGLLKLIQFPWRILMISSLCLIIPASTAVLNFKLNAKIVIIGCISLLLSEGVIHIRPVLDRTFYITSKTTYNQLIDGTIIDPFYSAFYVRVELAGADYLPIGSPNYKEVSKKVTMLSYAETNVQIDKKGTTLSITNCTPNTSYILPITYYKGYQVYSVDQDGKQKKVKTFQADNTLVGFTGNENTTYFLSYDQTLIQLISLFISISTVFYVIFKKRNYLK